MNQIDVNQRQTGLWIGQSGRASVRFWAPYADSLALKKEGADAFPLVSAGNGYWEASDLQVSVGDRYYLYRDEQQLLPDPVSLFQPEGLQGPSEVFDTQDFLWDEGPWKGLQMHDLILYELHTGTFSPSGDFRGILDKLDHLCDLGITAIEVMPVAQFPGGRNWGYDGVFPFAVQNSYGGPRELQKLVNACHQRGIGVILDVVYNHVGPEGNYLPSFGPFFTKKYKTPWGEAINFDGKAAHAVRRYFLENALMWLRDFHIDGLRLDAVHTMNDTSQKHFLRELKETVNSLSDVTGRHYLLIAETEGPELHYIKPPSIDGFGLDAQWCDDFHHAMHALTTGERISYFADYGDTEQMAAAFEQGYIFPAERKSGDKLSSNDKKTLHAPHQFVVFSQNHDQMGNRVQGDRLTTMLDFEMLKVVAGMTLLSPFVPLLFMGEEYGEKAPFLFFTSHGDPKLIEKVRKGRKNACINYKKGDKVPDPQAEDSFLRSKISLHKGFDAQQKTLFAFYKKLIGLRKTHPVLQVMDRNNATAKVMGERVLLVTRSCHGRAIHMLINMGKEAFPTDDVPGWNEANLLIHSASEAWGGSLSLPSGKQTAGSQAAISPASFVVTETF